MRPHQMSEVKPRNLKKKLREFVDNVGEELIGAIFDLAQADGLGKIPQDPGMVQDLKKVLKEILDGTPEELKKPLLDGKEIMDALGIKANPLIGKVKSHLMMVMREAWDKDNRIMTKEEALKLIKGQFCKEVEAIKGCESKPKAAKVVLAFLESNQTQADLII